MVQLDVEGPSRGVAKASEYDAEGLRYWRDQKASSVESGGQYAEQDAKSVTALNYWIAWRAAFPDAVWIGERFREPVTAKAPSGKPMVYAKRGAPLARTMYTWKPCRSRSVRAEPKGIQKAS